MTEVKIPKPSKLQQNSKLGQNKDFLKLNMQKLKKLSKENENLKKEHSPKPKTPIFVLRKDKHERKSNVIPTVDTTKRPITMSAPIGDRIKAGAITRSTLINNLDLSKLKKKSPRKIDKNQTAIIQLENTKKDQYVQTSDPDNENFLKNVKILEPSVQILEMIKSMKDKSPNLQKPKPQTRKFEKHSANLEKHLDNLKEFMERGSISRRRKTIEKRKEEIQRKLGRYGIMKDSFSIPTTFSNKVPNEVKFSPSAKLPNNFNKISKFPLEKMAGDGHIEDPKKLVVVYQRN